MAIVCYLGHPILAPNLESAPIQFEIVMRHGSCSEALLERASNGLTVDLG
jgi:hypothetical protein